MPEEMSAIGWIAFVLVVVGALNWGLIGVGIGNVVEMLGLGATINSIVYILVGLAAVYSVIAIATK